MRGFAAADHELVLLETLHDALDECEGYLKEQVPREQLKLVLREHFNVVMRLLNSSSSSVSGRAARASDVDDGGEDEDGDGDDDDGDGRQQQQQRHARHFDELNSASPEERQVKFMEIYFAVILPAVKEKAVRAHRRRHSTRDSGVAGSVFCGAASMHSRDWSAGSVQSGGAVLQATATATGVDLADGYEAGLPWVPATLAHAESVPMVPLLRVSHQLEAAAAGGGLTARNPLRRHGTMGEAQGGGRAGAEERLDERASNIWCTLVFRMLCYLLLHDFDQKDVQIPKSELVGSRLPVYIT